MRAASRRSYAAGQARLEELATGAAAERLRTVADDLLGVAELLAGQPRLRRVLADPARAGSDRAELLRGLLTGKVGRDAQDLLNVLVAGRWSAAAELLDAIELLGVEALLASAAATPAGSAGLAEVEDELFRFGQVVAGDRTLAVAIGDAAVPVARRATLVRELLDGKAAGTTIRLAQVALGAFGGRSVPGALTRLVELAAARRDRSVAYVTVATPLAEAEEQRLGAALVALYGREVSIQTTVDPRILGGMRVQVGADLYDGTVARRLAEARTALAAR